MFDNDICSMQWLSNIDWTDEEDLEEQEGGPHTNTRKSLAPLFVYMIIREESSTLRQLTLEDLLRKMDQYPYSIGDYDRRALARVVRTLMEEYPLIRRGSKGLYWDRFAA